MAKAILEKIMSGSLVLQIAVGIVAGVALSQISPSAAGSAMLLLGLAGLLGLRRRRN